MLMHLGQQRRREDNSFRQQGSRGQSMELAGDVIRRSGPSVSGSFHDHHQAPKPTMLAVGNEIVVLMKLMMASVMVLCVMCVLIILKKL